LKKGSPRDQRNRFASGFLIAFLLLSSAAAQTSAGPNRVGTESECVLEVRTDEFHIKDVDMKEALRLLRAKNPFKILIGFEEIPHREGEKGKSISLDVTNGTVEEILTRLCRADTRYTYEIIGDRLINVFPEEVRRTCGNLNNMLIRRFHFSERRWAGQIIPLIGTLAPELRQYLDAKLTEFFQSHGLGFPGYPGALMSTNLTPPTLSLTLENATVRSLVRSC
jgi:hypothetical protein